MGEGGGLKSCGSWWSGQGRSKNSSKETIAREGDRWGAMKGRKRTNIKQAGLETIWSQMCSDALTKISRMVQMADYTPRNAQGVLTIWYTQS